MRDINTDIVSKVPESDWRLRLGFVLDRRLYKAFSKVVEDVYKLELDAKSIASPGH